mmetsp:Transcript_26633/g.26874  ORF Transcript_26633/g.26874 Transcript_26633/m.26874 type:complete len:350 (+) Transcript_26633:84-1133(+)|eukprot:CAMPEP_0182429102 /NCGR_PEP_ID=MMETSP1167-20130531/25520_1 /TAXON_ID=2988 /ORGANISM="Mallomonas Sp, Strain CCMP3275" /LENGTH=349 /DNA_ID=CAMNT_0024612439 /DNA_START=82 /DNA_END=1131 /DNA_ORIENTATION=+
MPNSTLNPTFPQKLFFLMDLECRDIIAWLPHGLAFKVMDYKRFSEETIPKYFRHTKLTSFQRQLNLYGFRRVTKGEDQGAYFHPKFQRGRADLVAEIRRLPGKPLTSAIDYTANSHVKNEKDYDDQIGQKRSLSPVGGDSNNNGNINTGMYQNLDVKPSYEELKSSITNQQNQLDYSEQTVPAVKMSKLSMNIGYRRNSIQGSLGVGDFYPKPTFDGQNYVHWIPVATPIPMSADFINCQQNQSGQIEMPFMAPIMGVPQNFPGDSSFAFPTNISEGFPDYTDNTDTSDKSTSSNIPDWSLDNDLNGGGVNAGIPDDSNFTFDFDNICADADNGLDMVTVECLQDLLSC